MSVGQRIKKYREQLNLTMKELGELVNISESMISLYEADKNSPKLETAERMATIFNVSPSFLVFGEDSEEPIQEYDDDALELAQQLSEEGFGELNILFKKTGKLSKEEKERVMKILRATLPENGND